MFTPELTHTLEQIEAGQLSTAFDCLTTLDFHDSPTFESNLTWGLYFLSIGSNSLALEMLDRALRERPSDPVIQDILVGAKLTEGINYFKQHEKRPHPAPVKLAVYFDLNDGCNLNCIMCSERKNAITQRVLSREVYRERLIPILQQTDEFQMGCQFETLMVPWFEEAVFMLAEAGIRQRGRSISNGIMLSPSRAKALIECDVFQMVRFSIDGATAEVFETIRRGARLPIFTRNIERLVSIRNEKSSSTRIGFNFTVQKSNVHELPALVELAARMGVDSVSTHRLCPDDFGRIERAYHDRIMASFAEASEIARREGIEFLQCSYDVEDASSGGCEQAESRSYRCAWLDTAVHLRIDAYGNVFFDCQNSPDRLGNLYCSDYQTITEGFLYKNAIERLKQACPRYCGNCYVLS